jgi:lambda family phage minor tail protein L
MSLDNSTKNASKKIYSERTKLNPSALITLYELDFRVLGEAKNSYELQNINFSAIPYPYDGVNSDCDTQGVLRFHNLNINLESTSTSLANGQLFNQILWKGKRYLPFPIQTEGYEASTRGTLPKPKISFSNQYQIPTYEVFFKTIKRSIKSIGDLIGLKVTRRRTFLKYLDAINFKSNGGIINNDLIQIDPDPLAELPMDIFYIERKIRESKNILEYEMSSILDLENIKLPFRGMYSQSCSFEYRGEGCGYGSAIYAAEKNGGAPVASDKDENIRDLIGGRALVNKGVWPGSGVYSKGDYVYILVDGIRYYFVCKADNINTDIQQANAHPPTDMSYWYRDVCSKRLTGCYKRFNRSSNTGIPFGGFPATNRG